MEKKKTDILEFIKSEQGKNHLIGISELQMQRFSHALESETLAKAQFNNDFNFVANKLLEWKSKLKKDNPQNQNLNLMSNALMRMFIFSSGLEITIKSSIVEYQTYRDKNNQLLDTNEKLRNEVESLKKEIEFLNNG